MNEYCIDLMATQILTGSYQPQAEPLDVATEDEVRARILTVGFDSTPNWGINGVKDSSGLRKRNWYFLDPHYRGTAQERYHNIDIEMVKPIIRQATTDLVDSQAEVVGFGLYGSYFYRRNALLPEDLDALVLVENAPNTAIDALRYRDNRLREIFRNRSKVRPNGNELGISVVSVDCLTPDNKSYVVTDSALVDLSTTFSTGKTVDAAPLPPFIIVLNAQKIIYWGIASLLSKPFSLLSRIDEAIRMRNMLLADHPEIGLDNFAIENSLPSKEEILLGMNDEHFLELSRALINVLHQDELKIRECVARDFRSSSS